MIKAKQKHEMCKKSECLQLKEQEKVCVSLFFMMLKI